MIEKQTATRGWGLLERWLATRRANVAVRKVQRAERGGRILDLGCGASHLFLLRSGFDHRFGLDLLPARHEGVRAAGIMLLASDLEQGFLPFREAAFDAVSCLATLEHISREQSRHLLGEVHRVLRPGGVLVLTTPAPWTGPVLSLMAAARVVSPVEIDDHKGALSTRNLRELLIDAGFPAAGMRYGYFELFMNQWLVATKEN
jgi:SAM-dependent methyltransferase